MLDPEGKIHAQKQRAHPAPCGSPPSPSSRVSAWGWGWFPISWEKHFGEWFGPFGVWGGDRGVECPCQELRWDPVQEPEVFTNLFPTTSVNLRVNKLYTPLACLRMCPQHGFLFWTMDHLKAEALFLVLWSWAGPFQMKSRLVAPRVVCRSGSGWSSLRD